MADISKQELMKVVDFINSCNDMIDGKFILADVKIRNILSIIENSEELIKFIGNCTVNFNFERELQRAEVKNSFNGGTFVPPSEPNTLIAMVFCLLVSFDSKRIDFYQFIQRNFETLAPNGEYANFAKNMLVPFRDYVGAYFGVTSTKEEDVENLMNNTAKENEMENEDDDVEVIDMHPEESEVSIYDEIKRVIDAIIDAVYTDRKIKEYQKQQYLYVLKSTKYALDYEDMKLISAFVTCFDSMAEKAHSLKFLLGELKDIIKSYYDNLSI